MIRVIESMGSARVQGAGPESSNMKTLTFLKKLVFSFTIIIAVVACAPQALAQEQVFTENFEVDHTSDGTWITNSVGGYNPVDVYFDYSTVGIPPAPHSGATTRGLKLQANLDPAVAVFPSGSSASPSGFSITENFEMRWDWWLNFNGSTTTGLPGGGNGSTQIGGGGFGTAGTSANVPNLIDSIFIGASGDGTGTSADYRVYSPAVNVSYQDASGVYAAGTSGSRNNTHTYYQSTFPPVSAPAAQVTLYPQQSGLTQGGSAGMAWHDVSLKKIANTLTYTIDGLLIATVDLTTAGSLGGANILFGHFDINAGASTDPNATNLAFSLVDNIRITNFGTVVAVTASTPSAAEQDLAPGMFTITRTSAGVPMTVDYTITGTATSGTDYTALSGSVTFAASATETNIVVTPLQDAIAEASETIILSINDSTNYQHGGSATVSIADNEPAQLTITNVSTQMYERTHDYATFRLTRLGDLNTASFTVNLSFGGSATENTDYTVEAPGSFEPGEQTKDFKVLPIEDVSYEGDEIVTVNVIAANAGEYTIGSPSAASITLVDANTAPETVLFADNFNTDTSADWDVLATGADHSALFNYDYSIHNIPPAPHGTGDSSGVYLAVNKSAGSATAVNLYPRGESFSGNFALRFDMFLNVLIPSAVSTEYALFGINHSGNSTNWFNNSPGGPPAGSTFDGIFYGVESDGAGLGDYVAYSSPTTGGNNPTALSAGRTVGTLTNVLKSPPWVIAGAPANNVTLGTPIWADVEVSQIGNLITLRVNNSTIFTYTNATPYSSGNIMVGYVDAFNSVSLASSYMIIDNVRVVRLVGLKVASVVELGANMQIDFTFDLNDGPTSFTVQSASTVTGPYLDVPATIIQTAPGSYRATVAKNGSAQFYRLRQL